MRALPLQAPVLGILGGLGPLATVDFLEKLTRLTPAGRDQGHVPWLTVSQPGTPDRSTAILAGEDAPREHLIRGVTFLAAQGVSLIAVPCNASHYWMPAMRAAVTVPILHIAEAAAAELRDMHGPGARVAVLGTRGTVAGGVYTEPLRAAEAHAVDLPETVQHGVDAAIEAVKGGRLDDGIEALGGVTGGLSGHAIDVAILACTELSVIWNRLADAPSAVDSSLALARTCLRTLGYASR
jgi:aspartate racemase